MKRVLIYFFFVQQIHAAESYMPMPAPSFVAMAQSEQCEYPHIDANRNLLKDSLYCYSNGIRLIVISKSKNESDKFDGNFFLPGLVVGDREVVAPEVVFCHLSTETVDALLEFWSLWLQQVAYSEPELKEENQIELLKENYSTHPVAELSYVGVRVEGRFLEGVFVEDKKLCELAKLIVELNFEVANLMKVSSFVSCSEEELVRLPGSPSRDDVRLMAEEKAREVRRLTEACKKLAGERK